MTSSFTSLGLVFNSPTMIDALSPRNSSSARSKLCSSATSSTQPIVVSSASDAIENQAAIRPAIVHWRDERLGVVSRKVLLRARSLPAAGGGLETAVRSVALFKDISHTAQRVEEFSRIRVVHLRPQPSHVNFDDVAVA